MHRMFAPFGASLAIFSAPAKVPPEVMPTKMPSLAASSLLQRMASAPEIGRIRSMSFRCTASPGQLRNEIGRPALHRVRLETWMRRSRRAVRHSLLLDPGFEQWRIRWLADDDLRL